MKIQTETKELLDRYQLKEADIVMVNESHPIFSDMLTRPITFTAGGSGLNSMRGLKWMLKGTGKVDFVGCIGQDEYGQILSKTSREDGIDTHYQVITEHQTGCCCSIIYQKDRTLVAFVSAAGHYSFSHYQTKDVQDVVLDSEIFYATAFFILSSYETILAVGQYAAQSDKVFMMNISAPFLIEGFWDKFYAVFQYADIIVGNEHEATAFAIKNGWNTNDFNEIALRIAQLPKINQSRKRMVIITQGARNTTVCENDIVTQYPVPRIDPSLIQDTNGAGDSFVGGFLSGLSKGKSTAVCVTAGHYCAGYIIQGTGVVFSKPSSFDWDTDSVSVN